MINHRFQGLAKKICKTQAIVLAKRLKVGVRSSKLGILDGGFDFVKVQGLKQKKMGYSVIIIELVWTTGLFSQNQGVFLQKTSKVDRYVFV